MTMKRVVDWTKVLAKCTPESRKMLLDVRAKNEDLKRQILELKTNTPSLNFSRYENIVASSVVQEQQNKLNSFKATAKDTSAAFADLEAEQKRMLETAKIFLADLEKDILASKDELKRMEAAKPVEQWTVEDVYAMSPELKTSFDEKLKRDDWYVEDVEVESSEKTNHH